MPNIGVAQATEIGGSHYHHRMSFAFAACRLHLLYAAYTAIMYINTAFVEWSLTHY